MTRTINLTNASQGDELGRDGNMLFSSDPHFYGKERATHCSHRRGVCNNRIITLFDQGMVCVKTPSEYLASGRLLHSRNLKDRRYFAEYHLGLVSLEAFSFHDLRF